MRTSTCAGLIDLLDAFSSLLSVAMLFTTVGIDILAVEGDNLYHMLPSLGHEDETKGRDFQIIEHGHTEEPVIKNSNNPIIRTHLYARDKFTPLWSMVSSAAVSALQTMAILVEPRQALVLMV